MKRMIPQLAVLLLTAITATAQAPQLLNYQGVARSTSGAPMVSQPIGLQFVIHDGSSTGAVVYQETNSTTTNSFGLYTVSIGGGIAVTGSFSSLNWSSGPKYLEVQIDPAGGTAYTSVGSNQLLSVPYSIYANSANSAMTAGSATTLTGTVTMGGDVTGTNSSASVVKLQGNAISAATPTAGQVLEWNSGTSAWTPTTGGAGLTGSGTANYVSKFTSSTALGNSLVFDNGTSVGIGTATPAATNKLQVSNASLASNENAVHAIEGAASSSSFTAATAVYGESSTGNGVAGVSSGGSGVLGLSAAAANSGLYGINTATGGIGVWGAVTGAAGSYGGYFDGGTAGGYGVVVTEGLSGFGITAPLAMAHISGSRDLTATLGGLTFAHQSLIAQTTTAATSNTANAIIAYSGNSTYENHGLFGYADGPGGSAFNVGVFAFGTSTPATTGNCYGVYGNATDGANNYGIYGTETGSGYAGYFSGAIYATSASAGIKSFKIDDPRDPANKYLYHSSVESNEMMNIYKGHVTTDANGDATVTLPSYFTMLNKDYDYQLTCIGQFAQAIVSEEISNNQFKIKTDKPNVKVSWQVSGVRQDPAANAYRIVDEVEKPAFEKGTYLQPELYGQSIEKTTGYLDAKTGGRVNSDARQPASGHAPVVGAPASQPGTATGTQIK